MPCTLTPALSQREREEGPCALAKIPLPKGDGASAAAAPNGIAKIPCDPSAPRHRFTCTTFAGGKPLKWVELAAE
jgi:hypothetical protein